MSEITDTPTNACNPQRVTIFSDITTPKVQDTNVGANDNNMALRINKLLQECSNQHKKVWQANSNGNKY
jgi:hypothetical protein